MVFEIIKRFFIARGGLRWKILYALDFEREFEERTFFVCENLKPGDCLKFDRWGKVYKDITKK